jgi:16S rRNA processing protein RimM
VLVVVGRIGRAHGIRGELSVEIRTDEPDRRFAPGTSMVCGDRALTVDSSRPHADRLLVAFREVPDRTAAEQLHGRLLEVEVDPSERPDDPDELYDHQMVGLHVRDAGDTVVGMVTRVIHGSAQDTLVIDAGAHEILVPFVAALVPTVDVDAGFVRLSDVPGLLDPEAAEEVES